MPRPNESSKIIKGNRCDLLSGAKVKRGNFAKPVQQFRVLDITKWLSMELVAAEHGFELDPAIRARLDEAGL